MQNPIRVKGLRQFSQRFESFENVDFVQNIGEGWERDESLVSLIGVFELLSIEWI